MTTTVQKKDPTKIDSRLQFKSLSNPPSSVLEDGRFIYLPPANSTFFFGRSVAKYNLVNAEGGNDEDKKDENEKGSESKKDKAYQQQKEEDQQQKIHPIQIASARLQTHGIAELSKGINLSTLVQGNEYFGLTTVVDKTARKNQLDTAGPSTTKSTTPGPTPSSSSSAAAAASKSSEGKPVGGGGDEKNVTTTTSAPPPPSSSSSTTLLNDESEEVTAERKLRSQYILKRKKAQFESASKTLHSHYKKLRVVTTTQQTIDSRLLDLRKRWRLNVPNHNVHAKHPIQPCDVIAVDVDIYSGMSKKVGGGDDENFYMNYLQYGLNRSRALGRIARMVPHFATIELSNNYDIQKHLRTNDQEQKLKQQERQQHRQQQQGQDGNEDKDVEMKEQEKLEDKNKTKDMNIVDDDKDDDDTIAQPFLIKESTTNTDFQNNTTENIPMLTLVFQIEKSSTGFVQSVALSSNITNSKLLSSSSSSSTTTTEKDEKKEEEDTTTTTTTTTKEDEDAINNEKRNQIITSNIIQNKISAKSDELLIQSLQHSLFCANVFDSIRQEIIQDQSQQQQQQHQQQQQQQQQKENQRRLINPQSEQGEQILSLKGKNSTRRSNASNVSRQQQQQQQVAWLSTGVEDSFVPTPSFMAGSRNNINDTDDVECMINSDRTNKLLSVVYCHEGEVKVRLNSEYNLVIKLVDVNSCNCDTHNTCISSTKDSGSQSTEQLHLLCRLLLLQAQSIYHNSRKEQSKKLHEILQAQKQVANDDNSASKFVDYSAGINNRGMRHMNNPATLRMRKEIEAAMTKTPHILQSCVGLGAKIILEGKMRKALKRLLLWCKEGSLPVEIKIEWLSLSVFDPNSQLAISLSPNHILDVAISGNGVAVTSFGDDGGFRSVHFGTSEEFELFVKYEISNL